MAKRVLKRKEVGAFLVVGDNLKVELVCQYFGKTLIGNFLAWKFAIKNMNNQIQCHRDPITGYDLIFHIFSLGWLGYIFKLAEDAPLILGRK